MNEGVSKWMSIWGKDTHPHLTPNFRKSAWPRGKAAMPILSHCLLKVTLSLTVLPLPPTRGQVGTTLLRGMAAACQQPPDTSHQHPMSTLPSSGHTHQGLGGRLIWISVSWSFLGLLGFSLPLLSFSPRGGQLFWDWNMKKDGPRSDKHPFPSGRTSQFAGLCYITSSQGMLKWSSSLDLNYNLWSYV